MLFAKKKQSIRLLLAVLLAVVITTALLAVIALAAPRLEPVERPNAARTTVDGTWGLAPQTLALSGAQTLTPTVSYYLLAPTATMTVTLATGDARQGDFIYLVGTVSTSTVIVDTTATAGGGDRTIGQYDVIGFIYDVGLSRWIEAFYSDNS
jgi:hypothetical protein